MALGCISLVALLILGGIGYAWHYAAAVAGRSRYRRSPAIPGSRPEGDRQGQPGVGGRAAGVEHDAPRDRDQDQSDVRDLGGREQHVTLYVSTGPAKKAVPDVIGKKELDAESELTNAGFKVGKPRTDPSSSQPQGTVIDQSPAGNTLAKPGITSRSPCPAAASRCRT